MNNQSRRTVRDCFSLSINRATNSLKLDMMVESRPTASAKSADTQLARLQSLTLDTVGPHALLIDEAKKGTLSTKNAAEAVTHAIR